jgi:hypothetical protein
VRPTHDALRALAMGHGFPCLVCGHLETAHHFPQEYSGVCLEYTSPCPLEELQMNEESRRHRRGYCETGAAGAPDTDNWLDGPALTTHANSRILPSGGQGDARPSARGRAPVANTKIISIIDAAVRLHEIAAVEDVRAQVGHNLDAVRDLTVHAIADNTLALRHDINTLAAAINQLRADVDALKKEGANSSA